MSDDLDYEFEEGIFGDAGVDVNDVPDDPFGFGNDYWPVRIVAIKKPAVTKSGDKFGMMVKYIVDHPKYQTHWVGDPQKGLGNGHWTQLPVPKVLQDRIHWDPQNDPKDQQVLTNLKALFKNLGFGVDEMKTVGPEKMLHRGFLAKIKVSQTDEGFWDFRFAQPKPFPAEGDGEGLNEFAGGLSADELAKKELEKELG
jgi:hypothetical protein